MAKSQFLMKEKSHPDSSRGDRWLLVFLFIIRVSSMAFLSCHTFFEKMKYPQVFPVWLGIFWLAVKGCAKAVEFRFHFARWSCFFRGSRIAPPWQHFSLSCFWRRPTPYSTDMVFLEPNEYTFYLTRLAGRRFAARLSPRGGLFRKPLGPGYFRGGHTVQLTCCAQCCIVCPHLRLTRFPAVRRFPLMIPACLRVVAARKRDPSQIWLIDRFNFRRAKPHRSLVGRITTCLNNTIENNRQSPL